PPRLPPALSPPCYWPFSGLACSAVRATRHSFPTRRSSDLVPLRPLGLAVELGQLGALAVVGPGEADLAVLPMDPDAAGRGLDGGDRKSTRLNSSHVKSSYAVFCRGKQTDRSEPGTPPQHRA